MTRIQHSWRHGIGGHTALTPEERRRQIMRAETAKVENRRFMGDDRPKRGIAAARKPSMPKMPWDKSDE